MTINERIIEKQYDVIMSILDKPVVEEPED